MIKVVEIELNGSKYTITQMTARVALKMQARLIKNFGAAFTEILVTIANKGLESADEALPRAIMHLAAQLDDKTFEDLVIELTRGVRKSNIELTPQILDLEFAGELDTLFKLIFEILKVNYSDFFAPSGIMSVVIGLLLQKTMQNTQGVSQELKETLTKT